MNKKSNGKRRSRRRSVSSKKRRCNALLSKKVGINIHEGIYKNKSQAIAVAYSQVRKRHPSCRRILGKKKSMRRSKRSIRRRIYDGVIVSGSGTGGVLNDAEQNVFRGIFTGRNINRQFNSITLKVAGEMAGEMAGAAAGVTYNNVHIASFRGDNFLITSDVNREFTIDEIINYDLFMRIAPLPQPHMPAGAVGT